MTATNDTEGLSRTNPKSNEKGSNWRFYPPLPRNIALARQTAYVCDCIASITYRRNGLLLRRRSFAFLSQAERDLQFYEQKLARLEIRALRQEHLA